MGISFLSFNCFSSSNNSDKQQAAQSKVENTRTNLGTFSAIPFQNEVTAYTQPKTINKAQIAIAAATERMFEEVSVAETKAKITIAPYKTIDTHQDEYSDEDFNAETVSIINEQISPTCFRGLTDKDSTNLENIYVTTSENQFIAGRTGIIDTPKKAQHFDAIVRDQLINFPKENTIARVVSHQLNSPEAEGKMIEHQHLEMAILNQGQERYKVAHLNTPSNVLYDYTLYIRKIPLIGGFLGALIEGIFLYGERVSKDQNLEGLARMALWLKEDSDKVFYFEKGLSIIGMESLTDQMNALVDDIDEAVSANATGDLKEHRVSMKIHLMDYYNKLETLHQNLQPYVEDGENRNSFKQIQEKIALMKMILGDQLDIEGQALDRGCLNMAIELLNFRLGVHSYMNCKSGLDRTGYLFAVKIAMAEMEKNNANLFDMVTNWSRCTFGRMNQWARLKTDEINKLDDDEDIPIIAQILEFRKIVFENLRTHGLDATAISTGVFGFKWSTSFWEANRIPLNFLPSEVEMLNEEGKKIKVSLVNYNDEGRPTGLTQYGEAFLIKDSKMRGA